MTASRAKGKGKAQIDVDLEAEKEWLALYWQNKADGAEGAAPNPPDEEETDESGDGIECGCCFSSYSFVSSRFRCLSFKSSSSIFKK